MSTSLFSVQEHTVPCSYVRQYAQATADGSDQRLHLAVKQYIPLDNTNPQPGDVTILGGHANGFPKELYEPLWDEIYHALKKASIRIRSIWIADVAWQGYSSVLNEGKLGNDPNWLDHSRDLLLLTNTFAAQMPRPIIGIGHSMGGCQLTQLSLLHPRLLSSLVLIDPIISEGLGKGNVGPARASSNRRDIWPSRAAAATSFGKSKFYQAWDPRVLALWTQHGLRDVPTELYPAESPGDERVTLRTTKHNEVHSFLRPVANLGHEDEAPTRLSHPDVDPRTVQDMPFYRPEPAEVFARLPAVRPSVLYVFGAKSDVSDPVARGKKMALTGSGLAGSGGAAEGRVKEVLIDTGHLVPMEKVGETAREAAGWITQEVGVWKAEEERVGKYVQSVPQGDRARMNSRFVAVMGGDWAKL